MQVENQLLKCQINWLLKKQMRWFENTIHHHSNHDSLIWFNIQNVKTNLQQPVH